jgi:hypothetical protein
MVGSFLPAGDSMPNKVSRRENRHKFRGHPKGKLLIHVKGVCIPAVSVRDVSMNGMSLVLDSDEVGLGVVTFEYKSESIDIKVEGIVVWKFIEEKEAGKPQYVLGLELLGSSMLLASLMDS